ncbi:V-type ATP synthase subunit I [Pleurocapsales cyanobacterium LEGE 06147]|nr:V-type ATP synthase subunit I [Pleurocapsales cyanobacterium LEGE 06147]
MSIVPLNKVTLFGLPKDKEAVLKGLQNLGCMHLIALQPPPETAEFGSSERVEEAQQAWRYLMDVPRRWHQVEDESQFDLDRVVKMILANKQKRREAEDRRLFLTNRLRELEPWGEFTLPTLDELAGYRLWFYRIPHPKIKQLQKLALPWQKVAEDQRFAYVVVIAKEEPSADALPVSRTHAGSVSPKELKRQLQQVELELDEIGAEHQALSRWLFLLAKNLARTEDENALQQASLQTAEQGGIFLVQGWLPKKNLKYLDFFAQQHRLAFLAKPPQPDENPPTLMDNPPTLRGGQDLVSFYETPGYRTWDPSPVLFFSFPIFFAMILSDAGYALILAILVAYYWRKMGKSTEGRHFRILAVVGVILAGIYGILVGSYFGIPLPEDSLLVRFKFLNLNDYNAMMRFSIAIGCLHLVLANAAIAYHSVGFAARAKSLGWIAVIFGGLLVFLSDGGGGSTSLFHGGIGLLVGGMLAILFFSSDRPINSVKSVVLRLFDGVSSLVAISKLFGDVMSYLRLFALGLASASLALTFNQLAVQVEQAVPGLGLLLGILILLLGHGINLLLALVSGFVHGLRLNYIEFFNWSLPEEGYPFRAFAKKELNS